jgi:phosphoribosylaminoimidazole-succinocarboxamide synthase
MTPATVGCCSWRRDRISAFDVVMPQPIPWKGIVLTQISAWWFARLSDSHRITSSRRTPRRCWKRCRCLPTIPSSAGWPRAALVRRTRVVPIEASSAAYVAGSAWAEYRKTGTLAGEPLADGLRREREAAGPIFSPATKAQTGHDENITFAERHDAPAKG